jgi:hypothetical protein
MNLDFYLPNNSEDWIIKNNTIYYHRLVDIPILKERKGIVWVALDRRVRKQVLRLINHLVSNNVKFYLTTRFNISQKDIFKEDLVTIIENYILALTDEFFFDAVFDSKFDYVKNLTDFMTDYDCHKLFKSPYEKIKKAYLSEKTDWYTMRKYYLIKKEYIRDSIRTLEREIKISLFL